MAPPPRWKRVNVGGTRRYQVPGSERTVSRYLYDKIRKGKVTSFFTSETTHRSVFVGPDEAIPSLSKDRGRAFAVFLRWEVEPGKLSQTGMVTLRGRSAYAVWADLYNEAQKKNRPKSRLPLIKEEEEEEEEEQKLELVYVTRL